MSIDRNGSNSRERRHFSPQQKVAIFKEHLVDGIAISELCDRHYIQPTQFDLWQKQLFENGAVAFERKTKASGPTPAERQVERPEVMKTGTKWKYSLSPMREICKCPTRWSLYIRPCETTNTGRD